VAWTQTSAFAAGRLIISVVSFREGTETNNLVVFMTYRLQGPDLFLYKGVTYVLTHLNFL